MAVIALELDLHIPIQSGPITTKVVSSNPGSWRGIPDITLCEKFVSNL